MARGREEEEGGRERADPRQRWQPESVGVRQLCLRRGVHGQKSLKTAALRELGDWNFGSPPCVVHGQSSGGGLEAEADS